MTMTYDIGTMTAAITEYAAGKLSTAEIAKKYNVAPSTLTFWSHKLGQTLRGRGRPKMSVPTVRQRKILEMVRTKSYADVGKQFGVTKQMVSQIVNRWNGKRSSGYYKAGDVIEFEGTKYTVLRANAIHGDLQPVSGGNVLKNFVWHRRGAGKLRVVQGAKSTNAPARSAVCS